MCGEFGEVTVIIGLVINFLAFGTPFVSFRDTLSYIRGDFCFPTAISQQNSASTVGNSLKYLCCQFRGDISIYPSGLCVRSVL